MDRASWYVSWTMLGGSWTLREFLGVSWSFVLALAARFGAKGSQPEFGGTVENETDEKVGLNERNGAERSRAQRELRL
jgi:hypothetical protein